MNDIDRIDEDVVEPLRGINDPEIGISIVDLGLVYRAARTTSGVEVTLTLTTPSCPLGEMLADEVRDALRMAFPNAPAIEVNLVWEPPWSPARMSERARQQLR